MSKRQKPNFSQVVCGEKPVQIAFDSHRPTRVWWNLILRLHGKPTNLTASGDQHVKIVADGFRFYAWLYRFLALVFLSLSVFLFCAPVEDSSLFWAIGSLLFALYLWFVSGLGYVGAKIYHDNPRQGVVYLSAFMVMIVAFLCLFLAAVSIAAHFAHWLTTSVNLMATGALFVFGVGSYFIEIVYLATRPAD